jgi:hypothetical protein
MLTIEENVIQQYMGKIYPPHPIKNIWAPGKKENLVMC